MMVGDHLGRVLLRASDAHTAEERMWIAVIVQSFKDSVGSPGRGGLRASDVSDGAAFFKDGRLDDVCGRLKLNADFVREMADKAYAAT